MAKAYSDDFRRKVMQAIELDGLKKCEASLLFNISRNTINLWFQRKAETVDVMEIGSIGNFDLAVVSYLLNCASTKEQLLKMCQAIAIHLKPDGRFVSLNNNLELLPEFYDKHKKYDIARRCA